MNKFMEQAIAIKDDIVEYRRVIHSNPEVGAELFMKIQKLEIQYLKQKLM